MLRDATDVAYIFILPIDLSSVLLLAKKLILFSLSAMGLQIMRASAGSLRRSSEDDSFDEEEEDEYGYTPRKFTFYELFIN